jgi:hypothetical protein
MGLLAHDTIAHFDLGEGYSESVKALQTYYIQQAWPSPQLMFCIETG